MNIKLTVTEANCRCGYHAKGDEYVVGDICPPMCHELWYAAYPYIVALQNGATLEAGEGMARRFSVRCPDEGRVTLEGCACCDAHKTEETRVDGAE